MRAAAAAVILCLLSGCSMVRLAYDNAELWLRWRAGSYLDVHGEVAEELDRGIASFVGWHRSRALPQYAATAEEAAQRLSRGLSPEDLVWSYDSVIVQAREGLHAAAERIAPLLDRLDAGQLAHLEQRIAEDNRRFARENLQGSEQERRRRRAERVVERLEEWVGELSQAQLERVRQYSDRAPLTGEARVDYFLQVEDVIDGDFKYAIVNYAKPTSAGDFIQENKTLWKPFHETNIKNGMGMTAWGMASVMYPGGNQDRFSVLTWDGFNKFSDAMDYLRYQAPAADGSDPGPFADILSKSKMNEILPDGFQYRILYERVMTVE